MCAESSSCCLLLHVGSQLILQTSSPTCCSTGNSALITLFHACRGSKHGALCLLMLLLLPCARQICKQANLNQTFFSNFMAMQELNGGEPLSVLTDDVRAAIMKNITRRMTPQPLKIRADIDMTCFAYDGVLHIQVQHTQSSSFINLSTPPLFLLKVNHSFFCWPVSALQRHPVDLIQPRTGFVQASLASNDQVKHAVCVLCRTPCGQQAKQAQMTARSR